MGKALLLMTAVIDEGKEPDWEAAERAAAVWDPQLLSEDDYQQASQIIPALDEYDPADKDAPRIAEEIRETLTADLRYVRGAIEEDGDTQLTWIRVRGARIWVAGGDSWGDSPSEAFDSLWRLEATGVLTAAGFE